MLPMNRAQNDGGVLRSSNTNPRDVKPLIAYLDGKDCKTELSILKDVANVTFCDVRIADKISDRVLNEAVGVFMWQLKLTKADLQKFRMLKVIVKIGSGGDNIDLKAAGELGIAVCICDVPGSGVEEVADSTLCMILDLYRGTHCLANMVKDGMTFTGPEKLDNEIQNATISCLPIYGSTLGIIGLGRIGTAVALRAKALGFNVIVYDPYLPDGFEKRILGVKRVHVLRDLLQLSNCVSLHCTLNEHNYHLINESTINQMKPGGFFINTAERELVDEAKLAFALRLGQIRAAAIDIDLKGPNNVLEGPLKGLPNLICTPRTAYFCDDFNQGLREMAAREIRRAILGRIPDALRRCVNKEYLRLGERASGKPT